jgi:heterodisulfide reductase subunit B
MSGNEMMKYALLRCCTTPIYLEQYESSTDAVLGKLGVEFVDIKEFNCCGYPLKNSNFHAYVLSSARNLALAEKRGVHMMTFCNCCYISEKNVSRMMKEDPSARKEVNKTLEKEGLRYEGRTEVRHLLDILYQDIGIEKIKENIVKTFSGLKLALHYGCHILRPSQLVQFDDPGSASVFDQLVEVTGAENISWPTQLECCASPIWGINDGLSLDLTDNKLKDAKDSGADYLCVACPFCQLQFDRVKKLSSSEGNGNHLVPSILYTQLLGLSLGLDPGILGISKNELDASGIMDLLSQVEKA